MKLTHTLVVCAVCLSVPIIAQRRGNSGGVPEARSWEKTMFPQVRSMHNMVGGGNNFVVEAGLRLLAEGGNAVDAGVAATFAAAVTSGLRQKEC
jgi:hypothetical protein